MDFERLKLVRESLELSQKEIANKLKVGKSTYARWETGEKIIPFKHLINLCNLTGFSIDYTLGIVKKRTYLKEKISANKKIIGENLLRFRKTHNLTQEELASQLNTTHSTISAYENGKVLILTSFAYQIAKTYNISLDDLCYKK